MSDLHLDDLFRDADGCRIPVVSISVAAEFLSDTLDFDVSPFVIRSIVHENGLGTRIGNAIALGPEDIGVLVDELDQDLDDDQDDEDLEDAADDESEDDPNDDDEQR